LPRCLANFLRISNFSSSVNRALHFPYSKSPNPFISLRGSKELEGHSARAKPHVNRLIRTAQKLENIQTTIPAAEHSAPKNSPSAPTPQAPINCSNLGLDSVRPNFQAGQPPSNAWTALRLPNLISQSCPQNHASQSIKREAVHLIYQSVDAFATCVQTKQQSPK
jgi:hypothetical protein